MVIESSSLKVLTDLLSHFVHSDKVTVKRLNNVWIGRVS